MVGMDTPGRDSNGKPPSVVGRLGVSLFFLLFFGMGSLFTVFVAREFGRALGQRSWDKSPCKIGNSEIRERGNQDSPFAFVVSFQYEHDGRSYTGSTYKRNYSASRTYSEAQQLTQKYPAGLDTFCYVNPKNAGEAVLQRDSLAFGLAILLPLLFVSIGAGGLYVIWIRQPRASAQPLAIVGADRAGKRQRGLTFFFAVFAFAGGAMFYPLGIKPIARTIAAGSWRATPCKVLRAEVRSHSSDDGTTYSAYVLYQYEFEGQTYKADRYNFVGGSSSGYKSKARVVEQYRTAAHPICYVNPRDPSQAVLRRGFQAGLLFAILPLAFLLIGVVGLVGIRYGSITVNVSANAGTTKTWTAGRATADAPTVTRVTDGGRALLTPRSSPLGTFVGMTLIALFWDGIVGFIIWGPATGYMHGPVHWFALLFMLPFVGIGILLIGAVAYLFLAIFNPHPTLELSSRVVPLGGSAELRWSFRGRAGRIDDLTMTLRGVEETRYQRGTNTYTDRNTFYEMELYRTSEANEIAAGQVGFVVPADTMHSFEAPNNKILWNLHIHGNIRHWPDVKQSFKITVTPTIG